MDKVLITGGSGFSGQYLIRACLERGFSVTCVARHRPESFKSAPRNLKVLKIDLTHSGRLAEEIKKLRPRFVFHLAAQSIPRFSWDRPESTFAVNAGSSLHILEAVRKFSPQTRILLASSNQVYGRSFRMLDQVTERSLLWPENPYAASKIVAEYACLNYGFRYGTWAVAARSTNHIGRGQSDRLVFSEWCRQIALAEAGLKDPVLEVGNLDAKRDFMHVRDVISAYLCMIQNGKSGQTYNVCTGKVMVLKKIVAHLCRQAKVRMRVVVRKNRLRKDDPPQMLASPRRLEKLGWKPRLTVFDALDEMLSEWRGKIAAGER